MEARRKLRVVEFTQCPAWYARSPAAWPGAAHGVGDRTVYAWTSERRYFLEAGALGDGDELPGRLYDCLVYLHGREAIRREHDAEARERAAQQAAMRRGR